jgi:hypothetical protein
MPAFLHLPQSHIKGARKRRTGVWDSHNLIDRLDREFVGPLEAFKLRKWIEESTT